MSPAAAKAGRPAQRVRPGADRPGAQVAEMQGERVAAPDLMGRSFNSQRPDKLWCGDVTCIATGQGYLYLATSVLDGPRCPGSSSSPTVTNPNSMATAAGTQPTIRSAAIFLTGLTGAITRTEPLDIDWVQIDGIPTMFRVANHNPSSDAARVAPIEAGVERGRRDAEPAWGARCDRP